MHLHRAEPRIISSIFSDLQRGFAFGRKAIKNSTSVSEGPTCETVTQAIQSESASAAAEGPTAGQEGELAARNVSEGRLSRL